MADLQNIIEQQASRLGEAVVDINYMMGTVCISERGQDDIFMQGDEADSFIKEVEELGEKCPDLSTDIIERSVAQPYAENLWN